MREKIRAIKRVKVGLLCHYLCVHIVHTGSQILISACEVSEFLFAQVFADIYTVLKHNPQKFPFKIRLRDSNGAAAGDMAAGIFRSAATAIAIVVIIVAIANRCSNCGLNARPLVAAITTFIAKLFYELPHDIVTGSYT